MFFHQGIIDNENFHIFTNINGPYQILFYDQEPLLVGLSEKYIQAITYQRNYSESELRSLSNWPKELLAMDIKWPYDEYHKELLIQDKNSTTNHILVTSEHSPLKKKFVEQYKLNELYYFFHGFAALDWYRGYYALNYSDNVVKEYSYDYISYNRIILDDRSYRIYFVSKLVEKELLKHGQVSFGVTDYNSNWRDEITNPNSKLSNLAKLHIDTHLANYDKLIIDHSTLPGSASADIPKTTKGINVNAFWHIVTETVFYYDKLHLTEKIFKPIVSKQPFMLLAAPGNLAYLRSYGFKTFDGIIDESYDNIQDPDARIDAVVEQLNWYCNLSAEKKQAVIEAIAPIVEYNFHHFYGEFKHIITQELLDNCKTLFREIGYDDKNIAYDDIYKVLTR